MATIDTYLDNIKNKTYGEDVRDAIHDGIQQCYTDATDVVKVSDTPPTSENTRIWIKPVNEDMSVPTWEEHEELAEQVEDLESALGNVLIDGWSAAKQYIDLSGSTANLSSPTSTATAYRYVVIPVVAGDDFTISATGGNASRAYGFVAGSDYSTPYKILAKAPANVTLTEEYVVAPENAAYLVINDREEKKSYTGMLKSVLIERFDDFTGSLDDYKDSYIRNNHIHWNFLSGSLSATVGEKIVFNPANLSTWTHALVPCRTGDTVIVTAYGASNPPSFAKLDADYRVISTNASNLSQEPIEIDSGVAYLLINNFTAQQANPDVYREIVPQIGQEIASVKADIDEINESVEQYSGTYISGGFQHWRFKPGSINTTVGEIVDLTNIKNLTSWTHALVPCNENDNYIVSASGVANPATIAYLDSEYRVISKSQTALDDSTVVSNGASYLLICNFTSYQTNPFVKKSIESTNMIVSKNGGGNYTNLVEALKETTGNILVMPGDYDLIAEYKEVFGNDIFNYIADDYTEIGEFRFGAYVNSRTVKFEPGAKITADISSVMTVDTTHRFAVFIMGSDAHIIGANIDCTGGVYVIHDDLGVDTRPYFNSIEDCVLIGRNLTQTNVIGGGCQTMSDTLVKNCYLDNNNTGSTTMRYHNTFKTGAKPRVTVESCYANGYIDARWYGSQTTKMTFIAHNNECVGVRKRAEGTASVDNVDLYAWANHLIT